MDRVILVANLKSNQTQVEAKNWLETFANIDKNLLSEKLVIICPSFTLLPLFKDYIQAQNLDIKLGAQNASPFGEGPYTGEINARQIKEFADYVLIGHSERRKNFKETDDELYLKFKISLENGLSPIYLIQDKDTLVPQGVKIVAYEPIFAIGTGDTENPDIVNEIAQFVKSKSVQKVLYGGSVISENIKDFTSKSNVSGALIGGASLDAQEFIQIIKNA